MKKILLIPVASISLLLTGCISLFNETVGVAYDHGQASTQALASPAAGDTETTADNDTPAPEGAKYKLGFAVGDTQYYANKSVVVGIGGVSYNAQQTAIAKGTSLVRNSTTNKWDRIQDHAVSISSNLSAGAGLTSPEDFTINNANISFKGNLANGITGYTFAELDESASNQPLDTAVLEGLIPDSQNITANIGDFEKIFDPREAYEPNLYGVYGNDKLQYTAFYAASTDQATTNNLTAVSGAAGYSGNSYDVNFRGVANDAGTETLLSGTGTSNINFGTGAYSANIDVVTKSGGGNYGNIAFSGTAAANSNYFNSLATFAPTVGAAINGNAEVATFGDNASNIMGITDFVNNDFALVGAFDGQTP